MRHVLPAQMRHLPMEQGKAVYRLDDQIVLRIPSGPIFHG